METNLQRLIDEMAALLDLQRKVLEVVKNNQDRSAGQILPKLLSIETQVEALNAHVQQLVEGR